MADDKNISVGYINNRWKESVIAFDSWLLVGLKHLLLSFISSVEMDSCM